MKVRDIMTTQVTTADPDATLETIATMMKDENVGAIPVVEGDDLCGIITDRDIVVRCIAEGLDPRETTAEEILTESLDTVEPDSDIDEAATMMSRRQVRRLPVVQEGRLVGMVSIGDIAVKQHDDEVSGDALEGVSRGVKKSTTAGQQSGAKAQTAKVRGPQRVGTQGKNEGRAGRLQQQALRQQANSGTTGRSAGSKHESARGQDVEPDQQGITSHRAGEEMNRNDRVVPFRSEGKAPRGGGRPKRRAS